jgi:hypothetical protein
MVLFVDYFGNQFLALARPYIYARSIITLVFFERSEKSVYVGDDFIITLL